MQLYGLYTSTYYDYLIEQVHRCTPLISLPARGRILCGLDDPHGLRQLVQSQHLKAAIAPSRNDALMQSCNAIPGRLDVHEGADDVPINVLLHVSELRLDVHDIERLKLFGLETIGKLRHLSERHLQAQFGERGSTLYHFIHEDDSAPLPLYVPPPSIIITERFDEPSCEPGLLMHALDLCVSHACIQLGARLAWRVEVASLDRADAAQHLRNRILRSGSNSKDLLLQHMQTLMREMLCAEHQWWGLRIGLASLGLPIAEQTLMFAPESSFEQITRGLLPRYAHVMKNVVINNPWSVIPEEFGKIVPMRTDDTPMI
jgi:hypothetical protein